jgi:hypothetical protein
VRAGRPLVDDPTWDSRGLVEAEEAVALFGGPGGALATEGSGRADGLPADGPLAFELGDVPQALIDTMAFRLPGSETPETHHRGIAVTLAREIARTAQLGQVLVTQTVRDLIFGSDIALQAHDQPTFDDLPGQWSTFLVIDN